MNSAEISNVRDSLRVRLLLPVLALVLVVVIVLTIVLAVTQANRVRTNANESIERQTSALQSLFAVTRSIMLDRVHSSMRLLQRDGGKLGPVSVGPQITVGGRPANDLLFGGQPQGNNFALVDSVTAIDEGTATIFARTGDEYVRIATNVKKDDGSRAIGTVLDPHGKAIQSITKGEPFYGVVDILGTPYVTGYDPILAGDGGGKRAVGIWYVGFKTNLEALEKVVADRRVLDSGFIAIFDANGKLRFQSKTGATTDPAQIEAISGKAPDDWTVTKQDVPDWGFTLVSAYPKSDINGTILKQSLWIIAIGVLVGALLLGMQSTLIWNRVLRPIQHLTTVADELSKGKWNNTIEEVDLKDEIGTLARAISRLSNSVRLAMERLSKR
ncbi:Cache 3/Cache 2 fusion domain-containing protein [Solilutibacter silvestris]|uniref:histidine kinase n=1 Tax=Solilutibacter silvestris TaxID=1645665 RepID=A0A2K1PYN4_9GAMM|nr:Cache 3/Cache 2 fusion domain-containing protein [Lysobacter silvestris]PNS07890.1 HAMP domain-containing protein [Lysobacter silvestris]